MTRRPTMRKVFRDQTAEKKAACSVTEDASDDTWVYCGSCERAMKQGDCGLSDDSEDSLHCAYEDCAPEGNLAFESLYGWDAYRLAHELETADWPEEPRQGTCYKRSGAGL
jgi:hypothetical protein